jgi:hypothetical protein
MSSVREQIVARMAAALATLVAPVAIPVYRSREIAFARGDAPALVVRPEDEETQVLSDLLEITHFNVHVEIIVRGDVWDSLADPIAIAAHSLLLSDTQLAALCSKIRRASAKWDAHEADQTAGVLSQMYHVIYQTPTDQL